MKFIVLALNKAFNIGITLAAGYYSFKFLSMKYIMRNKIIPGSTIVSYLTY